MNLGQKQLRKAIRRGSVAAALFVISASPLTALAGPPFVTDDPEPTDYRHWEIYTGATYENDGDGDIDASLPFAEFNYGALPNVQVSISLPLNMTDLNPGSLHRYGNGGIDFGIKTRFVQESENRPQISFYPSIETPEPGVGNHVVTLLPVWLQKSWGTWTAFGGGGIYLNPGAGNRNYTFAGGTLERIISPGATIGAELFHQSSPSLREPATTGANVGAIVQVGTYHAILFSIGRGLTGNDRLSSYASYEFELGPGRNAATSLRP